MNRSSRQKEVGSKQEDDNNDLVKIPKAPTSSRTLVGFKNPRIVRVPRSFGGKDRHSKVCTIRGLRDRRIRLSVPTAIQLYDLQDRLGLNQPSKVIDWLLDKTKDDIETLPPLQIPLGFGQFHQPSASQSSFPLLDPTFSFSKQDHQTLIESKVWDMDAGLRGKGKVTQDGIFGNNSHISPQTLFPSLFGLNNHVPYNFYYNLEPSNLSLSQFGGHEFVSQSENPNFLAAPKQVNLLSSSVQHMLPAAHSINFLPKSSPWVVNPGLFHLRNDGEQLRSDKY